MESSTLTDINVESDSYTHWLGCTLSGSAVVSADKLLLADRNNNKVKLIDTRTRRLLSERKLPSDPWDVAAINTNKAAVTLPNSKTIILLGIANILTSQREITVSGECHGVAYSQDRLVVTFVDSPRIEIIDLQGNVISTIENHDIRRKEKGDDVKLFMRPEYVCFSKDGETIYVSDFSRGTVTRFTLDGVVKSEYKDKDLIRPHKVCTDNQGNVHVCGRESQNVHTITAECRKIKVILTRGDGLGSFVYSVSHCQDTNRLFIGMWGNNNVKVYQLL